MIKIATHTLLLAGAILLGPVAQSLALSTEDAPTASDGSSQIADPDEALDQLANPNAGTDGGATIEEPPIVMPGDESNDYMPPDPDDDPADVPPPVDSGN